MLPRLLWLRSYVAAQQAAPKSRWDMEETEEEAAATRAAADTPALGSSLPRTAPGGTSTTPAAPPTRPADPAEEEARRQRLRRIEAKVVAKREELEEGGCRGAELEAKVTAYRLQLEYEESAGAAAAANH